MVTREEEKSFTFNCNFSSPSENKADRPPPQLPFWALKETGIPQNMGSFVRNPGELSRLAWELFSSVGKYLGKEKGDSLPPYNGRGVPMQAEAVSS